MVPHESQSEEIHETLYQTIQAYGTRKGVNITIDWDDMQAFWLCCGVDNHNDWYTLRVLAKPPLSCCLLEEECETTEESLIYTRGCHEALTYGLIEDYYGLVAWACFVSACTLLASALLSCAIVCGFGYGK